MSKLEKDFCCTLKTLMGRDDGKGIGGYEFYEDKTHYINWVSQMSEEDHNAYVKEINDTNPKMAAYASSARFIYKSFKDKSNLKKLGLGIQCCEDRVFEKIMKGKVRANFDMYLEEGKTKYYFEAKCRELFDYHYPYFPKSYKEIAKELFEDIEDKEYVKLKGLPEKLTGRLYFDIKQFVCHVLAIMNANNENTNYLIYLLYAPKELLESNDYKGIYDKFIEQYKSAIRYVKDKLKADINFKLFIKTSIEEIEPIKFIEKEIN